MDFMNKYVIFNVFYGQFLSSIDIYFLDYNYTSEFDNAMIFNSQYEAEKYASYVEEKVAVFKVCSIF